MESPPRPGASVFAATRKKLPGGSGTHLILQVVELLAGALAGGGGLLHLAVVHVLGGLLNAVARLIELLAGVGHLFLILRLVHAVA